MTYITSHLNINANIKFDDGKRLHASKKANADTDRLPVFI